MKNYLADIDLSPAGGLRGLGPLGLENDPTGGTAGETFNKTITSIIGVMSIIAFVWFVILLITGAIGVMSAGADKSKLEAARSKIFNGIIGIVVLIAAIFIVDAVGTLLGIKDILNPAQLIETISPATP